MKYRKIIVSIAIILISIMSLILVTSIVSADENNHIEKLSELKERMEEISRIPNSYIPGQTSEKASKLNAVRRELETIYKEINAAYESKHDMNLEELKLYVEVSEFYLDVYSDYKKYMESNHVHLFESMEGVATYKKKVEKIIEEIEEENNKEPEEPPLEDTDDPKNGMEWGLNIGDTFIYEGYRNDMEKWENGTHITPTTILIDNGGDTAGKDADPNSEEHKEYVRKHTYSLYCADRGDSPGSRLRQSSTSKNKEGDVIKYHTSDYCDENVIERDENGFPTKSVTKPNTETVYYAEPKFTIGYKYDIGGKDNNKQYIGYILSNVDRQDRTDPASWIAQNAIWKTDINRGYQGLTDEDPEDDFESDPTGITKSEIINQLSFEDTSKVEEIAIQIQGTTENDGDIRKTVKDYLLSLVHYFEDRRNLAETEELDNFYLDLITNDRGDGIHDIYTWVDTDGASESASDVRANAYQYLMTINNKDNGHKNATMKINEMVEKLLEDNDEIDIGGGTVLELSGALVSEAKAYQKFYDELQNNQGKLKVENKTNTDNIKVLIDRNTNTYTVGPFKVSYPSKAVKKSAVTGKRVDFAKITSIKILDQKGNVYKELSEESIDENGNKIEAKNEFLITKTVMQEAIDGEYIFPKNDEEFYVQFKGDGASSKNTIDPTSIKLQVDFSYISKYRAELYRTLPDATQSSYKWKKAEEDDTHTAEESDGTEHKCRIETYTYTKNDSKRIQEQIVLSKAEPVIEKTSLIIEQFREGDDDDDDDDDDFKHYDEITMKISGRVFWDQNGGKESLPNGILDEEEEMLLKNIEVSLYEYDEETGESTLATLAPSTADENGKTEIRTNPTITNENGYYVFEGVRAMNKYYVEFKYNGQIYQSTIFTEQTQVEDESQLRVTSNAMEIQDEEDRTVTTGIARTTYNARFSSIESAPYNYETTNSLEYGVSGRTYTQSELKGYKLVSNVDQGIFKYEKDDSVVQLLDDIVDGELTEGVISQKINKYMYGEGGTQKAPTEGAHGQYPNLKDDIYNEIIDEYSDDPEIKDKLQFIEDMQMTSTTKNAGVAEGLLANEDQFTLGKKECQIGANEYYLVDTAGNKIDFVESMDTEKEGKTTITYHSLYGELSNINLGVNERAQADISLRQDVEKVTLEINGKTQVYEYDQRNASDEKGDLDDQGVWDIGVRLSDGYFNKNYSRELYKSDYLYKASQYGNAEAYGKSKSDELEVYVTYKITVRNQAMSVKTRIDEIVQYYDEDYEYVPERSYAEIKRGANQGKYTVQGSKGEQLKTTYNEANKTSSSRYGSRTQTTIPGYETLYIQALDNLYLGTGQTAYVYVTFRVEKENRDNEDWIKIDESEDGLTVNGVGKECMAEINGYSTIYEDEVEIPNVGNVGGQEAGIIDRDSNPGNLEARHTPKDGTVNFLEFEDDTDKAPNIRITLYRDHDREIEGTVWEDERTEEIASAMIGNGIKDENETPINGVTVQLVELMENGTEFIWRQYEKGSGTATETSPIINKTLGNNTNLVQNYNFNGDSEGKYAFKSFVPGTYMVRFIYGDTVRTVLVNSNASGDDNTNKSANISKALKEKFGEDGLNKKSYNGQDYKSTTYQAGIAQTGEYTYKADANPVRAYTNVEQQNESGTYYYNIEEADKNPNVSDAKDIMKDDNRNAPNSRPSAELRSREEVIEASNREVTNHIAEVLASYVERPAYENTDTEQDEGYTDDKLKELVEELINKTKMTAETGVMNIEIEYNTVNTGNQSENNKLSYQIKNVNLGLQERPKSQIAVEKEVTNVKVSLSDQSILFDATDQAENVLWQRHKNYDTGYVRGALDSSKFGSIERIRALNSNKYGVIQLSMDEEIMHGATIQISYKITARNVGEIDYLGNDFYYTGNVSNPSSVSATSVDQVVDYIANNLRYNASNSENSAWTTISKDELKNNGLVNEKLETQISDYSTILITDQLGKSLIPTIYKEKINPSVEDSVSTTLVLSQVISPENEGDDLSYRNIIEAVKTSNTVGRKNEYSVVGNQNPRKNPQELDSDMSETVKILPPFGAIPTNYILWITVGMILIAGVGFIIFKVLKKDKLS